LLNANKRYNRPRNVARFFAHQFFSVSIYRSVKNIKNETKQVSYTVCLYYPKTIYGTRKLFTMYFDCFGKLFSNIIITRESLGIIQHDLSKNKRIISI